MQPKAKATGQLGAGQEPTRETQDRNTPEQGRPGPKAVGVCWYSLDQRAALPCTHDQEGPYQELQNAEGPGVPVYAVEPLHRGYKHGEVEHS